MVVAQIPRIPQESAVAPNLNRRPLGAQSQVWLFDALRHCQRGVSNRNLSTAKVMRAEKKIQQTIRCTRSERPSFATSHRFDGLLFSLRLRGASQC